MKIGNYIKEKRLQKGMTQEELALKSDITVRTIQRIESGEVDPRSFTLQAIASALEVDYNELVNVDDSSKAKAIYSNERFWLAMIHLSGMLLLIFPTVIIWIEKKDKILNIRDHAINSINFQLSMNIYLITSAFLVIVLIGIPILILLGVYILIIVIINAAKAANYQPFRYPLTIQFLK